MKSHVGASGSQKLVVKNKTPNPVQITAEQLLREAIERQQEEVKAPRQRIFDEEELQEYRIRKRKDYEDALRRQRHNIGVWIKYAEWEAAQREFRRARSIFERALGVEFQNVGIWLKYINMETKNKFINPARNLYDRVTQLLPRIDQFWFKYAYMEELLGNYAGARSIFERWMEWNPDDKGWLLYVKFEERCGEVERARKVFERYLVEKPSQIAFLRYAKFEEKNKNIPRARASFEKAIEILPEEALDEAFYTKFAEFEDRQKEYERVKCIFEQALNRCPREKSQSLYKKFVSFQKQRGDREIIEKTVTDKRRLYYEELIQKDSFNYDLWFDLIRLEENAGHPDRIQDVYERAIAQVPLILEKRHWKRYIYLFIYYALFEEIRMECYERARDVWEKAIEIVPHGKFSFAKIWILYAEFEIRRLQLDRARLIYGRAIAECKKDSIFTNYAALELRLGNIDRCRIIHAKYIETHPTSPKSWISMIDCEILTEEIARARALCEIAIQHMYIEFPEQIWKRYIDLESDLNELDRVASLYERLLGQTQHFKVFKAYSTFELERRGSISRAREIIERGINHCKDNDLNEDRKFLIDHWVSLEKQHGDKESIAKAISMKPKTVVLRRNIVGTEGITQGYEEITRYIFKDDEPQSTNLKILEKAREWKRQQLKATKQRQGEDDPAGDLPIETLDSQILGPANSVAILSS